MHILGELESQTLNSFVFNCQKPADNHVFGVKSKHVSLCFSESVLQTSHIIE